MPSDGTGFAKELAEGFRFVRGHRALATVTLLVGVLAAADAGWFSVLLFYTSDVLGLETE